MKRRWLRINKIKKGQSGPLTDTVNEKMVKTANEQWCEMLYYWI